MKHKLKIYTIVNDNDPNDTFEVEAKNSDDAAHFALENLGWWVSVSNESENEENKNEK